MSARSNGGSDKPAEAQAREKSFTDKKMHEINFGFRPSKDAKSNKPLQQLLYAFQDVDYNFHTSPYFKHQRELRDNMKGFMI